MEEKKVYTRGLFRAATAQIAAGTKLGTFYLIRIYRRRCMVSARCFGEGAYLFFPSLVFGFPALFVLPNDGWIRCCDL